jgi:hypothetical protein
MCWRDVMCSSAVAKLLLLLLLLIATEPAVTVPVPL